MVNTAQLRAVPSTTQMKDFLSATTLLAGIFYVMPVNAAEILKEGVTEWSFSVGYGKSFHTDLNKGNVGEDIRFAPFLVSWGKVKGDLSGGASWGYAIEGFLSYARQAGSGRYAIGITPLLVYNFPGNRTLVPYADVGVGIVATNLDPEGFGSDYGFTPQLGIGIRYAVSKTQMIKLAYRFHHISNAGLKDNNLSIDSNMIFLGYSILH